MSNMFWQFRSCQTTHSTQQHKKLVSISFFLQMRMLRPSSQSKQVEEPWSGAGVRSQDPHSDLTTESALCVSSISLVDLENYWRKGEVLATSPVWASLVDIEGSKQWWKSRTGSTGMNVEKPKKLSWRTGLWTQRHKLSFHLCVSLVWNCRGRVFSSCSFSENMQIIFNHGSVRDPVSGRGAKCKRWWKMEAFLFLRKWG